MNMFLDTTRNNNKDYKYYKEFEINEKAIATEETWGDIVYMLNWIITRLTDY